jgi:hypothetical protein
VLVIVSVAATRCHQQVAVEDVYVPVGIAVSVFAGKRLCTLLRSPSLSTKIPFHYVFKFVARMFRKTVIENCSS